jgi:hypothetical protein
MASSPHSDVLLEAVAPSAETSARTHPTRRPDSPSHSSRTQSERLLAHVKDNCQRSRNDQCVARRTRNVKHQDALGRACSASLNRRMRARMYGGVGRAVSDGRPYPITPGMGVMLWGASPLYDFGRLKEIRIPNDHFERQSTRRRRAHPLRGSAEGRPTVERKPASVCVSTGLISPLVALSSKLRGYGQKRHIGPVRVDRWLRRRIRMCY